MSPCPTSAPHSAISRGTTELTANEQGFRPKTHGKNDFDQTVTRRSNATLAFVCNKNSRKGGVGGQMNYIHPCVPTCFYSFPVIAVIARDPTPSRENRAWAGAPVIAVIGKPKLLCHRCTSKNANHFLARNPARSSSRVMVEA
jgi:hypothetical protein